MSNPYIPLSIQPLSKTLSHPIFSLSLPSAPSSLPLLHLAVQFRFRDGKLHKQFSPLAVELLLPRHCVNTMPISWIHTSQPSITLPYFLPFSRLTLCPSKQCPRQDNYTHSLPHTLTRCVYTEELVAAKQFPPDVKALSLSLIHSLSWPLQPCRHLIS